MRRCRNRIAGTLPLLDTLVQPTKEMGHKIRLDDIVSPIVRQGYDYWLSKKAGRAYPSRAEIRPAEIKKLLPNVILVQVLGDNEYRYPIVGQANAVAHGFNATNWNAGDLDEQVPGYTAMVVGLYAHIRKTGRPIASKGSLIHLDRGFKSYESIYMPLGPENGPVDHLFAVADYSGETR
jgi:hypothetical protein